MKPKTSAPIARVPASTEHPTWLLEEPKPQPESRMFNGKLYVGWHGRANLLDLEGWVDNPRLDIPVEKWKEKHAGRMPDNQALLGIMLEHSVDVKIEDEGEEDSVDGRRSRRNKLLELAQSISLNEVRVPLILTYDGRILDGNRRYFASLYLYTELIDDEDERERYETLPVWVLPKLIKKADEDRILTELNSINDCQVRWPYSVLAKRIYEDYTKGMDYDALAKKYHSYAKDRLKNIVEASKVANEFIAHHDGSLEAKDIAYRKLIWFDELKRSNRVAMESDEFREGIFDAILSDNPPFTSHKDFLRLGDIFNNLEAWTCLTENGGKGALKQARFIVDRERYEGRADAQSQMSRVNNLLKGIAAGPGFGLVDGEVLSTFHELATQVPNPGMDAEAKMMLAMELMNSLTSKEMPQLSEEFLSEIATVLERVRNQVKAHRIKTQRKR
jgi:hypothetical protein